MKRFIVCVGLILLALLPGAAAAAQDEPDSNGGVSLTVLAGFETYFRDSDWFPVTVRLRNDGEAVSGQLVIRPETTSGVLNTTSTPVSLPAGARQTAVLYVTARAFTNQIRVELLEGDTVIAQQTAPVRAVSTFDPLYMVITESTVGAIDLTGAQTGENVFQAHFQIADLPERLAVLDAVDAIALSDVDTGSMTDGQVAALRDWVASGGHLIVTGGASWQSTAAGIADLLPLIPEDAQPAPDLSGLADWMRTDDPPSDETLIATGTLQESARVLASVERDGESLPVLIRRTHGDGVVDYLAADPNSAPLRGWTHLSDLWTALLTTGEPLPGWGNGFIGWEPAGTAAEILPGFDPLPDVLPLFGFLALYILLIGPLNYFILARINRREWAWVTIPIFIVAFSAMAYTLGANLRGNEVTLSRLTVVRGWQDSDQARVDVLLGLLSPRRASYSFSVDESSLAEATFRPLPRPPAASSVLTRTSQSSVNIVQGGTFEAVDFNVDASFVAAFNAAGSIPKPAIEGSATFVYDDVPGQQTARGSVRNNTDMMLTEPVILARGVSYHVENALAPGELLDFELTLPGEGPSSAARRASTLTTPFFSSRQTGIGSKQSVQDILGQGQYDTNITRRLLRDLGIDEQEARRRQWLLTALIEDYFEATGRGDRVYLAAWSDVAPLATALTGANWNSNDRTLYLIELESSVAPATGSVVIPPERFSWSALDSQTIGEVAPISLTMQPGETASLRFVPLPDAILSQVDELIIEVDNVNVGAREFPVYLWNWGQQTWDEVAIFNEVAVVREPEAYLGPENTVQIRLTADEIAGFLRIGRIGLTMIGEM